MEMFNDVAQPTDRHSTPGRHFHTVSWLRRFILTVERHVTPSILPTGDLSHMLVPIPSQSKHYSQLPHRYTTDSGSYNDSQPAYQSIGLLFEKACGKQVALLSQRKKPRDVSCLSVVSFSGRPTKRRVESFIVSYVDCRFVTACS